MNKPQLKVLFEPKLKEPILIEGLPGFGEVGKLAAGLLIEFIGAKPFAELYSPYFPDTVFTGADGLCRIPRYEFYASQARNPDLIALIGDAQPAPDDVNAHYELCNVILDFSEKYNCKHIITLGGYPTPAPETGKIYVAATSERLVTRLAELGASIYKGGRIIGAAGLVLGLAKNRGLEGFCILGATSGILPDRPAAMAVFRFLKKVLEARLFEI
jgi:uncharacterized protein (TIGR00162 family)